MRAYFVFYAPRTPEHKPRVVASVPTEHGMFQYIKDFTTTVMTAMTAEWQDGEWGLHLVSDESTVIARHQAAVTANGVPTREWALDIPDAVYRDPLGGHNAGSERAPVNKWFVDQTMQFDGTDTMVGSAIPSLTAEEYHDRMRMRVQDMTNDALGAIVLRTASVGQKDVPKVAPIKGPKTYTRPNGETYYSRKWGEHTDVEVMRKAREIGKTVYLKSLPGTGKTALTEAAFGDDLYTIVGSASTEGRDFIGSYVPNPTGDGTFLWYDGPLVKAAKEGKPLFIDEGGLIDSRELSVVYPLMDGRDTLVVTENPSIGTIKVQKGFMVIVATNPNAPGVRMSEALMSRLDFKAEMTTDYDLLEKVMGVNAQVCRASANLDRMVRQGDLSWAPQFRELLTFQTAEKAFGTRFAMANLLADLPEHEEDQILDAFMVVTGEKFEGAQIV